MFVFDVVSDIAFELWTEETDLSATIDQFPKNWTSNDRRNCETVFLKNELFNFKLSRALDLNCTSTLLFVASRFVFLCYFWKTARNRTKSSDDNAKRVTFCDEIEWTKANRQKGKKNESVHHLKKSLITEREDRKLHEILTMGAAFLQGNCKRFIMFEKIMFWHQKRFLSRMSYLVENVTQHLLFQP